MEWSGDRMQGHAELNGNNGTGRDKLTLHNFEKNHMETKILSHLFCLPFFGFVLFSFFRQHCSGSRLSWNSLRSHGWPYNHISFASDFQVLTLQLYSITSCYQWFSAEKYSQEWWPTSVYTAFGKLRKRNFKLVWVTEWDPVSKRKSF